MQSKVPKAIIVAAAAEDRKPPVVSRLTFRRMWLRAETSRWRSCSEFTLCPRHVSSCTVQRKVSLRSSAVDSFERLLRWNMLHRHPTVAATGVHPNKGTKPTTKFTTSGWYYWSSCVFGTPVCTQSHGGDFGRRLFTWYSLSENWKIPFAKRPFPVFSFSRAEPHDFIR